MSRPNRIIVLDDGQMAIEVRRRNGETIHYRIDNKDVEKVSRYRWFYHNGYCCALKDNKFWYLAWELTGRPKRGDALLYLNGDIKDSHKSNIQRSTWSQRNLRLLYRRDPHGSSGIRGISLYKNGLYVVAMGSGNKRKAFRNREDAIAARQAFERRRKIGSYDPLLQT